MHLCLLILHYFPSLTEHPWISVCSAYTTSLTICVPISREQFIKIYRKGMNKWVCYQ